MSVCSLKKLVKIDVCFSLFKKENKSLIPNNETKLNVVEAN